MLYKNTRTGEITEDKATARKWHRDGNQIYILNLYGYNIGVWYWDKRQPHFYGAFVERVTAI